MAKRGKKYQEKKKKADNKVYNPKDAIKKTKELSYTSFPGSIDLHIVLNIPKSKEPKSIKGTLSLPNPVSANDSKIAVFTNKEKEKEAKEAGADFYDLESLVKEVEKENIEFDIAIASPDLMPKIAKLGKVLGPRGLMPNPKTDTVREDIKQAVKEFKKGKTAFACDSTGVMHFTVGKEDTENDKIIENINECLKAASEVIKIHKYRMIKKAYLAPTMGPSVKINLKELTA